MQYQDFSDRFKLLGKRREAGFIIKYYVEGKKTPIICEELYLNSTGMYYKLKQKVRRQIQDWIIGSK